MAEFGANLPKFCRLPTGLCENRLDNGSVSPSNFTTVFLADRIRDAWHCVPVLQ